jgi:hypothetical protein
MNYCISILSALALLASCQETTEVSNTNPERDSLMLIQKENEESITQFIATFNEIERNLDSVAVRQNIIFLNSEKAGNDIKLSQKNRIIDEIKSINQLMEENTKSIETLKSQLSKSNKKNKHLHETIAILEEQLLQKNHELIILNERINYLDLEVAQLKTTIDTLRDLNYSKTATISANIKTMHQAYYVIGKSKELQEAKLIDKQGGLLGIGKTPKLNNDFDMNKFTRVDYTQFSTIPVNGGAKIITVHPSDSYTLDKDLKDKDQIKNIVITNPEKFWSASKYLVIIKS